MIGRVGGPLGIRGSRFPTCNSRYIKAPSASTRMVGVNAVIAMVHWFHEEVPHNRNESQQRSAAAARQVVSRPHHRECANPCSPLAMMPRRNNEVWGVWGLVLARPKGTRADGPTVAITPGPGDVPQRSPALWDMRYCAAGIGRGCSQRAFSRRLRRCRTPRWLAA